MHRLKKWIKSKLDKWAIDRFENLLPTEKIINLYKRIAKRDLLIEERVVNVKKGKRRYTLLILKDRKNETVFNLGRHQYARASRQKRV